MITYITIKVLSIKTTDYKVICVFNKARNSLLTINILRKKVKRRYLITNNIKAWANTMQTIGFIYNSQSQQ